jgi:hypothetical protein
MLAEWTVEQGDLRDSRELVGRGAHHDLPKDFLKAPLGCEVESGGSSFGYCRRQTDVHFLGGVRPISIGRVPTKGCFSCPMLVVRERLRFCHARVNVSR